MPGRIPVSITIILLCPFRLARENPPGLPTALRASKDGAAICLSPDSGASLGPAYNGVLAMLPSAGRQLNIWEGYEAGLG